MSTKPGNLVRIITSTDIVEGVLMPESSGAVFVKLSNGYNIGIDKKNIKKIEVLKKLSGLKKKVSKTMINKKLPTISILHTGGTIASKVDYNTGAVSAQFNPEELISMFPELNKIANLKSRLVSNMLSENIRFDHYNIIAKEVKKEFDSGVDGVIITHGTDTLHYSSAALSFMIEGLSKPVILTAAQRSSDRGSSDAALNLINAVYFAANSGFGSVAVCMHSTSNDNEAVILPALKCRKLHSSRRDAFMAVNGKALALVNYKANNIKWLEKNLPKKAAGKISVKLFNPKIKIGILYQHPNMSAVEVEFYKNFDGLVIAATGLGNLSVAEFDGFTKENTKIYNSLKKLISDGLIIVLAPQTIFGRLHDHVYENQVRQKQIGVLAGGNDMTIETTFVKLAWLLSNYNKKETKELILKNLRGEISERSEYVENFLE